MDSRMLYIFLKLQFKSKKKRLKPFLGNHNNLDNLMVNKKDIRNHKNAIFEMLNEKYLKQKMFFFN